MKIAFYSSVLLLLASLHGGGVGLAAANGDLNDLNLSANWTDESGGGLRGFTPHEKYNATSRFLVQADPLQTCAAPGQYGLVSKIISGIFDVDEADYPKYQIGCTNPGSALGDFANVGLNIADLILNETGLEEGQQVTSLLRNIIKPVADIISGQIVGKIFNNNSAGVDFNLVGACVGDFETSDGNLVQTGVGSGSMIGRCNDIPVGDNQKWTTWASTITLPAPVASSLCKGAFTGGVELDLCIAASFCGDLDFTKFPPEIPLPSIAFAIGGGWVSCLTGLVTAEATVGIGSGIASGVNQILGGYSAGYSMTNAFDIDIVLYDGYTLYKYDVQATIYDRLKIGINGKKLIGKPFGDWFRLTLTGTRGLGFRGPTGADIQNTLDTAIGALTPQNLNDSSVDLWDVLDELNLDEWAAYGVMSGNLAGIIEVSKISIGKTKDGKNKTLGALFPDINIDLIQINSFFTTGPQTHVTTDPTTNTEVNLGIARGLFFFAGTTGLSGLTKELVNFLYGFVKNVLKPIPGFLKTNLGIDEFLTPPKAFDTSVYDLFGAGITINQNRTGFLVNIPLAVTGRLTINCYTNYTEFDCEVTYIPDDLKKVFKQFVTKFFEVGDKVINVVTDITDGVGTTGKVILVGVDDLLDGVDKVFSNNNIQNSLRYLEDEGKDLVGPLAQELGIDGRALQVSMELGGMVFDIANTFATALGPGIKEVAKFGKEIVAGAQVALETATTAVKAAAKAVGEALDCTEAEITRLLGDPSGSTSCPAFVAMNEELAAFANDVGEAVEGVLDAISTGLGLGNLFDFDQTRIEEKVDPEEKDAKTKCPLYNIYTETQVCIPAKCTTHCVGWCDGAVGIICSPICSFLGYECKDVCVTTCTPEACLLPVKKLIAEKVPLKACVKDHFEKLAAAKILESQRALAESLRDQVLNDNLSSLKGDTYTVDLDSITCTTKWLSENEDTAGNTPLEVTCSTPGIQADGSIGEYFNKTRSEFINPDNASAFSSQKEALIQTTKKALIDEITKFMTKEPTDCIATAGYPADGVDNDCDSLIDEDVTCNYADMIDGTGMFDKDCKCAPPVLDASTISDKTLNCTAPRGPSVLGRPTISFGNASVSGCPSAISEGQYLSPVDTVVNGQDPATACGTGQLVRQHTYQDSLGQNSNTVSQLLILTSVPPQINTTVVKPLITVSCEAEVPPDPGSLAPAVGIPGDLAIETCATNLEDGYEDLSIDYVGCPENPAGNGNWKGWNVVRKWFVRDECGQEDILNQTIVRQDMTKPYFESFPQARIQSCRSSSFIADTGFPVAADNCDPAEVLGTRISYSDTVVFQDGCTVDTERDFSVSDRVCNVHTEKQSIHSCPMEFEPMVGSTTSYDPTSLLPTFVYNTSGDERQTYLDSVVFLTGTILEDGSYEKIALDNCKEGVLEYLAPGSIVDWNEVVYPYSQNVTFKVDEGNTDKKFSAELADHDNPAHLPYFQSILDLNNNGIGTFRLNLECRDPLAFEASKGGGGKKGNRELRNGHRDIKGCLMFHPISGKKSLHHETFYTYYKPLVKCNCFTKLALCKYRCSTKQLQSNLAGLLEQQQQGNQDQQIQAAISAALGLQQPQQQPSQASALAALLEQRRHPASNLTTALNDGRLGNLLLSAGSIGQDGNNQARRASMAAAPPAEANGLSSQNLADVLAALSRSDNGKTTGLPAAPAQPCLDPARVQNLISGTQATSAATGFAPIQDGTLASILAAAASSSKSSTVEASQAQGKRKSEDDESTKEPTVRAGVEGPSSLGFILRPRQLAFRASGASQIQ
ncbi:expressed unknown protein [Seminavis robusta]|uniref:Uncharacterized protein n=1 Tax=Seminavis robusta TaxID=568900 RepID=A0A9N8HHB8_9STRA|nr:expressed unknown protein [Seminavis robusta]|eukprot:Sro696_g188810.1 n/a (1793) ;mRNA; f:298-6575